MTPTRRFVLLALVATAACVTDQSDVGPALTALAVRPDSTAVAVGDSVQLIAVGKDTNSVPFVGFATTWSSSNDGIATVSPIGRVHGVGMGVATITATAQSFTASATVSVEAAPAIALSSATVPFTAVLNGPDPAALTVLITNGGGTILDQIALGGINYAAGTPGGWLAAGLNQTTAPATVTLTASITGLALGTYTATVPVSAPKANNSPQDITVTLTVGVGAATQIALNGGDGQTATVNAAVATAPSVLVRDQYNNPVPNVPVTFAVASGGGSVVGGNATTNGSGIAQPTSWTLGTSAGANTLTATSAGLTGSPITFTATATASTATQIAVSTGQAQSATVNSAVGVAPAVIVRDQFNNPVQGVGVAFAVASGGGAITGGNATSGPGGIAQVGSWTLGTAAGANSLTATAAGLTGSPVTFTATGTAGAATQMALDQGNAQSATVNTAVATAPSVLVRDQFGNGVQNVSVTFTVTGGGGGVTSSPATSDASGIARVGSWTLGTAAGANGLNATAAGLTGSPVAFTATGTAGPAAQISINDGDNQSAQVATLVPTAPSILVGDQYNNPVAGTTVTFQVTGGAGNISGATPVSDGSGIARVGSWTLGGSAGANTLSATALGLAGSPQTFTATGFAGSATTLSYDAGDAQTDTVGATLAVAYRVRATDTNGNGVQNVPVAWAVTGGGGSILPASSNTDVNGYATSARTLGTVAGTQTAAASVGGLAGSPVNFTATANAATATQVAVAAGDAQSATVNTAVATAPAVLVQDQFGNSVAGVNVTFAVTGGGGTVNPVTTIPTNGSGVAQVTSWTLGTAAGSSNNSLNATSAGLSGSPVPFTASATADVPDATQSQVAATGPISACNVGCSTGGGTVSAVTITVRDQYANAVAGANVTWSATGTGNSATNTGGTTDAFGQFTAGRLSSTVAATKTVSALVGALSITQTAGVVVSPDVPSVAASSAVASDNAIDACNTSCAPGGANTASTITATVRDQFSNTINGAIVTFSSTGSNNTFTASAVDTTSAGGLASRDFNSTLAQGKTISATVTGTGAITQTAGVTVSPAAASQITITTQPANATAAQAFGTQPAVQLRDQFGNAVSQSGVSIRAAVFSGTGTIMGDTFHVTNGAGQAAYDSLHIDGVYTAFGNHSVRFTSGSLTGVTSSTVDVQLSFAYNVQNGVFCSGSCPTFDQNSCAVCHGSVFTHADLVNVPSSCGGIPYITPNDTTTSFLYDKVRGIQACGSVMPPSGSVSLYIPLIRRWILQGAPDN